MPLLLECCAEIILISCLLAPYKPLHTTCRNISCFSQLTFPGQNKDKQTSAAIPGVAAPQVTGSSSAGTNLASAGPKRILTKSKRALSEADLHQAVTAEKPASPSKSQASVGPPSDGDQMTQGPPPKSAIGAFHHLPHYMKLYEITKGAFANNQVVIVVIIMIIMTIIEIIIRGRKWLWVVISSTRAN